MKHVERKRGERVWCIARALGGKYFVEGEAEIRRRVGWLDNLWVVPSSDNLYWVRFLSDRDEREELRYINPEAQGDPRMFVRKLNAGVRLAARLLDRAN